MSQQFIPFNAETATSFEEKLSKTFFRDSATFVLMYNSGMINRTNDDVTEILAELLETYKGIEKRRNEITFLTAAEIAVDELITNATAYKSALQVKRTISDAVQAGHIDNEDTAKVEKYGTVVVETEDGETELVGIKHGNIGEAAQARLLAILGAPETDADGTYRLSVHSVLNLDESGVKEAAELLA